MVLPDINKIWSVSEHNFNELAIQIFHFQVQNNVVYAQYAKLIDQDPLKVEHYTQIPFLPISFFKSHKIVASVFEPETVFESSTTTGTGTSKHLVKDQHLYYSNCRRIIEAKLGSITQFEILGLLPNYLERSSSSLVSMVKNFMDINNQTDSFYLYNHKSLAEKLKTKGNKLLFGVSFALLDFVEEFTIDNENITIIETGGMKGRKKELTKKQVYDRLQKGFPNASIFSEYGMTELMSQAYSDSNAVYTPPPWMKVLPRADNDPLSYINFNQTAALNIIDFANLHTCSFIATDDLGKINENGSFEVIGRLDNSDLRGCSLMI